QRVVLGGDDEGGRQAAEVGGVQRADSGSCPQGRVGGPQFGAQATSSAGKPQPVPFSVTLGCDKVRSVLGKAKTWAHGNGPTSSRSRREASAARFPPELSPAMIRARSVPVSSAWCSKAHRTTWVASSTAAGQGCSGA